MSGRFLDSAGLAKLFDRLCRELGVATRTEPYQPVTGTQMSLF